MGQPQRVKLSSNACPIAFYGVVADNVSRRNGSSQRGFILSRIILIWFTAALTQIATIVEILGHTCVLTVNTIDVNYVIPISYHQNNFPDSDQDKLQVCLMHKELLKERYLEVVFIFGQLLYCQCITKLNRITYSSIITCSVDNRFKRNCKSVSLSSDKSINLLTMSIIGFAKTSLPPKNF